MSERPTQVIVCGQLFAIADGELGEHEYGRTRVAQQRIFIGLTLAPAQERDTVLHEVIHAAVELTGHELREGAVAGLATALLSVLRCNPQLVAWLVE